MGAARVEAVTDAKFASERLSAFDYVVIKEVGQYVPSLNDGTTVHWGWVKDCLIASRHLPLPEWPEAESQGI